METIERAIAATIGDPDNVPALLANADTQRANFAATATADRVAAAHPKRPWQDLPDGVFYDGDASDLDESDVIPYLIVVDGKANWIRSSSDEDIDIQPYVTTGHAIIAAESQVATILHLGTLTPPEIRDVIRAHEATKAVAP